MNHFSRVIFYRNPPQAYSVRQLVTPVTRSPRAVNGQVYFRSVRQPSYLANWIFCKQFKYLEEKLWKKNNFEKNKTDIIEISVISGARTRNITHVGQRRTHVKISELVTSLQTSRQQVVFARLVPSCPQVWNKLLTTCSKLVDIVRLVTRLFQQGCYNHDITILLQPGVVNLVTFLLYHDCIRLVRTTL